MKITIDTKEDSHDDIKKVIRMLSSLVSQEVMSNQGDIFRDESSSEGSDSNDIFNMFNAGSGSSENTETKEENQEKKEEKDELDIDIPGVEEYH